MTHTVQPKETLYSISRKYGVSVTQIQEWNGLSDTTLSVGQDLIVSADGGGSSYQPVTPSYDPTPSPSYDEPIHNSGRGNSGSISVQKINKGGYNSIIISYPTAYGSDQSNPMRDNYPSPNTVNTAGVSYVGKSTFEAQRGEFDDLLPQPFYGDLLHYIGKNEGCFALIVAFNMRRCVRSIVGSNPLPSLATRIRICFLRGKWQTVPTHFLGFTILFNLHHLPMI